MDGEMVSVERSPAATEALAGLVERVTFHNAENGFCVLRVKVRGQRDLITVVGHAAMISAGEWVQASGTWINDRTHGLQFKAAFVKATQPTTLEGIEKYLGSGMIKGIGPVYAKKLVRAFGEVVFDVIEQDPSRLREVTGIGPKRAERIVRGWADQRAIREIMLFLHANGVGTSRAVRIYKTYGQDAIRLISENPYRLARDIRGIGFKTADAIAARLGIAKTALIRVRAGISYALAEAMDEGHCGLPQEELETLAVELLEVEAPLVVTALDLELAEGAVVADTLEGRRCVFLAGLYQAEKGIAGRLYGLCGGDLPWTEIAAERAITWVEGKIGMTLAPSQREAVTLALGSKVLVITGGPGCGKTTLVNAILAILRARRVRVALCAPTGRAARRLSESTGLEARTIHRLLEVDPTTGSFRYGEDNPLDGDLLVVDEASMIDVPLMNALLKALPKEAALILVGDVDQLPSVGPGQVLGDVIASGAVPVVRLTEVFRQAAQSRIIVNAHRINHGRMPELTSAADSDFFFVEAADPEDGVRKLIEIVRNRIPRRFGLDPVKDVQVLSPTNRGGLGARSLNVDLQQALNPPGEVRVERFGWTFGVGDKVMQTENDYTRRRCTTATSA
jgi:exodeoxyribonuclease V alpha subunit